MGRYGDEFRTTVRLCRWPAELSNRPGMDTRFRRR